MNTIWVNQDIDARANRMIAGDSLYGIGEYFSYKFEDDKGRMQEVYLPNELKDNDEYKTHVRNFINDLIMEPLDLTDFGMGDYWPDGVAEGTGYDVLLFEDQDLIYGGTNYGGITITMLVEEATEYEL